MSSGWDEDGDDEFLEDSDEDDSDLEDGPPTQAPRNAETQSRVRAVTGPKKGRVRVRKMSERMAQKGFASVLITKLNGRQCLYVNPRRG